MDIFYNMHFYRALRNTDTRNNWCPQCVPCLQWRIVPYEIIWWVNYKLTIKVHMLGYKFSWCILILDDTPLWCPITHVDCAMQQGHSVKWDRFVSTLHMLHHMQHSIAFWNCPEYKCLASKVLVLSLTVVSYNPIHNSWTMEIIKVWWFHWAMQQDTTKPHLKHKKSVSASTEIRRFWQKHCAKTPRYHLKNVSMSGENISRCFQWLFL